jgi:group I intron endonuclease
MIGVVYQLQFPNGKLYIGITTRFRMRMGEHRNCGKSEAGHVVKRAIMKYGWANVKISILERGIDSKEVLKERERYWIREKGSMVHEWGYNLTEGGDAQPMDHPVVKDWHKKRITEAMNRDDVREKKRALWQNDEHKEMMQGARLNFESAEKRRLGFARKREEKVRGMSVADGKRLMLKVREKLRNNATSSRKKATPGQLEDAYAFWDREWARYSRLYWEQPSGGFDFAEPSSPPRASSVSTTRKRVSNGGGTSRDVQGADRDPVHLKPLGVLTDLNPMTNGEVSEDDGWDLGPGPSTSSVVAPPTRAGDLRSEEESESEGWDV